MVKVAVGVLTLLWICLATSFTDATPPKFQLIIRAISAPELDQPLQLVVKGIRRTPVLLPREVRTQCDAPFITARNRILLAVARKPRLRSVRDLQQWVVNRFQKGLTGDFEDQNCSQQEKSHARTLHPHQETSSPSANCEMRTREPSPRKCTPMASRKTSSALKTRADDGADCELTGQAALTPE